MPVNDPKSVSNRQKVIEFVPYKTMVMDLESILANLARIYVSRNNIEMVEIVTMSQAELFPVGSFDPDAEKYEYVLNSRCLQNFTPICGTISKASSPGCSRTSRPSPPRISTSLFQTFSW
jgi:hypothetical protein